MSVTPPAACCSTRFEASMIQDRVSFEWANMSEARDPAPRVDERDDRGAEAPRFVDRVHAVVRLIPYGRVTTYGRIARALGAPRSARMVGWAMHNGRGGLPFHRVVNRDGVLT